MNIFPEAYDEHRLADAKRPIWVFETMFAHGAHGIEGEQDAYLTTAPVSSITDFPHPERWFPILDVKGGSSVGHRVNFEHGVATISGMTFKVRDLEHKFSDIIRAASQAGHGFGQQLCQVYRLYEGMSWNKRVLISTQRTFSSELDKSGAFYRVKTADIQTRLDKDIFEPFTTVLSTAITGTPATMTVGDARNLNLVPNVRYGIRGFVQLDDEILEWSVKSGQTLTISGRGMFGTVAADHEAGADVVEVCAMHENPITMALKIMCSTGAGTNGVYDVLPAHWGCGLTPVADIDLAEWEALAADIAGLDDPLQHDQGMQYELVTDSGTNAKLFIERKILQTMAAYGFVGVDGNYSARALTEATQADRSSSVRTLTANDLAGWGNLKFDDAAIVNQIRVKHYEYPKLSGKLKRKPLFINQTSIDKNQVRKAITLENWLVRPEAEYVDRFYQTIHRYFASRENEVITTSIDLLERDHDLGIGDAIILQLPLHDRTTGADLDRLFVIKGSKLDSYTGRTKTELESLPETVGHWGGDNIPPNSIAPSAFMNNGTQINWDGLGGSQTVAAGQTRTLEKQDYWVNGDLTIEPGATIINKGARIYVTGAFTHRGHVDGFGRGGAAGAGRTWTGAAADAYAPTHHVNGYPGAAGGGYGKGGKGGKVYYLYGQLVGLVITDAWQTIYDAFGYGARALAGWARNTTPPSRVNVYAGNTDANGTWLWITGLPKDWNGSGGGGGRVVQYPGARGGAGGAGGAGFIVVAGEGIYATEGTIDAKGKDAADWRSGYLWIGLSGARLQLWISGGGGGGGGGSVGLFSARNPYGIEILDVDTSKISIGGGIGLAGNPADLKFPSETASWKGEDGTVGIIRTQIIG